MKYINVNYELRYIVPAGPVWLSGGADGKPGSLSGLLPLALWLMLLHSEPSAWEILSSHPHCKFLGLGSGWLHLCSLWSLNLCPTQEKHRGSQHENSEHQGSSRACRTGTGTAAFVSPETALLALSSRGAVHQSSPSAWNGAGTSTLVLENLGRSVEAEPPRPLHLHTLVAPSPQWLSKDIQKWTLPLPWQRGDTGRQAPRSLRLSWATVDDRPFVQQPARALHVRAASALWFSQATSAACCCVLEPFREGQGCSLPVSG